MVNFADVKVVNCAVEKGKKDPTKEYMKVLVTQGMDSDILIVPTVDEYMQFQNNIGKEVRVRFDFNRTYGRMQYSALVGLTDKLSPMC